MIHLYISFGGEGDALTLTLQLDNVLTSAPAGLIFYHGLTKMSIQGDQKKLKKGFYKFLQFWRRKWILVGKIYFPSLFILWSKVEKS